MSEILTREEIKRRLSPVLDQYGVKRAVLFGSYGKGTATLKSDVDLLVDSGLRGLHFMELVESVRFALDDKDVDIFDISHIDRGSKVDSEIKRTGIEIYAQ